MAIGRRAGSLLDQARQSFETPDRQHMSAELRLWRKNRKTKRSFQTEATESSLSASTGVSKKNNGASRTPLAV
jgi:hypothetical protein